MKMWSQRAQKRTIVTAQDGTDSNKEARRKDATRTVTGCLPGEEKKSEHADKDSAELGSENKVTRSSTPEGTIPVSNDDVKPVEAASPVQGLLKDDRGGGEICVTPSPNAKLHPGSSVSEGKNGLVLLDVDTAEVLSNNIDGSVNKADLRNDLGCEVVPIRPTITKIKKLSIYKAERVIHARVLFKDAMTSWKAKNGKASLFFSMALTDSPTDTIRATFFGINVDLYDRIQVGKSYIFDGGELKVVNPRYKNTSSHCEFTFNSSSLVYEAPEIDDSSYTKVEKCLISELEMTLSCCRSICATVVTKNEARTYSNSNGKGCVLSVDLEDKSGLSIRAKFFNEAAERFDDLLEENNTYFFFGYSLKLSDHEYDDCSSKYEMTFNKNSIITKLNEGTK